MDTESRSKMEEAGPDKWDRLLTSLRQAAKAAEYLSNPMRVPAPFSIGDQIASKKSMTPGCGLGPRPGVRSVDQAPSSSPEKPAT